MVMRNGAPASFFTLYIIPDQVPSITANLYQRRSHLAIASRPMLSCRHQIEWLSIAARSK